MIYPAILRKSHDLNSEFLDGSLALDDLVAFLKTLDWSVGLIAAEELKNILIIRRKWIELLFTTFGKVYSQLLDTKAAGKLESISDLNPEIGFDWVIAKSKPQIPEGGELYSLSHLIDPVVQFDHTFKQFDPEFHGKFHQISNLQKATQSFRAGDLCKALKLFNKVIASIEKKDRPDHIDLFSYAWALHGGGNVHFVEDEMNLAYSYFNASQKVRTEIPKMPKLLIYGTKVKLLSVSLYKLSASEWFRQNNELNVIMDSERSDFRGENLAYYHSLKANVLLNLGMARYYSNDDKSGREYIKESVHYARKSNDHVAELRSYICRALPNETIGRTRKGIEIRLEKISHANSNPYLKRLVSNSQLSEWAIFNPTLANVVSDTFNAFGIKVPIP